MYFPEAYGLREGDPVQVSGLRIGRVKELDFDINGAPRKRIRAVLLLDKQVDAFTAMGTSMALVWNNLSVMVVWGAIVLALFIASVGTGLVGLIIVFPLLGHATWHAYQALRP